MVIDYEIFTNFKAYFEKWSHYIYFKSLAT